MVDGNPSTRAKGLFGPNSAQIVSPTGEGYVARCLVCNARSEYEEPGDVCEAWVKAHRTARPQCRKAKHGRR